MSRVSVKRFVAYFLFGGVLSLGWLGVFIHASSGMISFGGGPTEIGIRQSGFDIGDVWLVASCGCI